MKIHCDTRTALREPGMPLRSIRLLADIRCLKRMVAWARLPWLRWMSAVLMAQGSFEPFYLQLRCCALSWPLCWRGAKALLVHGNVPSCVGCSL